MRDVANVSDPAKIASDNNTPLSAPLNMASLITSVAAEGPIETTETVEPG